MPEAVMRGVSIYSKERGRNADTFELALTYQGIEIRRSGEAPRHLPWDRINEWEIEQRRGGALLTLRGGGSVTPLIIPKWRVDDLDAVLRDVTAGVPAPSAEDATGPAPVPVPKAPPPPAFGRGAGGPGPSEPGEGLRSGAGGVGGSGGVGGPDEAAGTLEERRPAWEFGAEAGTAAGGAGSGGSTSAEELGGPDLPGLDHWGVPGGPGGAASDREEAASSGDAPSFEDVVSKAFSPGHNPEFEVDLTGAGTAVPDQVEEEVDGTLTWPESAPVDGGLAWPEGQGLPGAGEDESSSGLSWPGGESRSRPPSDRASDGDEHGDEHGDEDRPGSGGSRPRGDGPRHSPPSASAAPPAPPPAESAPEPTGAARAVPEVAVPPHAPEGLRSTGVPTVSDRPSPRPQAAAAPLGGPGLGDPASPQPPEQPAPTSSSPITVRAAQAVMTETRPLTAAMATAGPGSVESELAAVAPVAPVSRVVAPARTHSDVAAPAGSRRSARTQTKARRQWSARKMAVTVVL
ncbi:MAG TPA: hypothetical protein VL961_03495, partial [Acidimicrobiales bacterium]|nr:hypothetical protein [Acidimicrobiales bacterium]